jgi:hypothetical protein
MIPDGKSGDWEIETFEVSEDDAAFTRMRAAINPGRDREVLAGKYKKLSRNGSLVMSDTKAEILDHRDLFYHRRGRILIHGLGLGMATRGCLLSPEVTEVTTVEIDRNVIDLVSAALFEESIRIANKLGIEYKGRLSILHDDAMTWKPPRGARYEFVWHDIWDNICTDNLEPMRKLHRRFNHRTQRQASWSREQVTMLKRRGW